jgi:hypothetical protein
VLDCRAEGTCGHNDLSVFDGDGECDRQICDLRVKGKSEAEVCTMLGCTIPDIHRALDRAAQAAMTPAARVRDIYLDAARMERSRPWMSCRHSPCRQRPPSAEGKFAERGDDCHSGAGAEGDVVGEQRAAAG